MSVEYLEHILEIVLKKVTWKVPALYFFTCQSRMYWQETDEAKFFIPVCCSLIGGSEEPKLCSRWSCLPLLFIDVETVRNTWRFILEVNVVVEVMTWMLKLHAASLDLEPSRAESRSYGKMQSWDEHCIGCVLNVERSKYRSIFAFLFASFHFILFVSRVSLFLWIESLRRLACILCIYFLVNSNVWVQSFEDIEID